MQIRTVTCYILMINVQAIVLTVSLDDLSKDSSTIISIKDKYFSTLRLLESTFTRFVVNF